MRELPGRLLGNRRAYLDSVRGSTSRYEYQDAYQPLTPARGRDKASSTAINPDDVEVIRPTALTTAKSPALPFTISLGQHGVPTEAIPSGYHLTLLVPPKSFSISSSHINSAEFTRNGYLPTLWGTTQPVISLQGSSPAFMTEREGLTSAAPFRTANAVTRKDSLGYRNFMGLVAMFKANGYKRLNNTEDPFMESTFVGQTSRVIHVLDCIHINYDGTTYFGHFSDLSITSEVGSPYNFKYSMSFTVTGIKGDYVRGHIGDGKNQDSGIIIGTSATLVSPNMALSRTALQVDELNKESLDRAIQYEAENGGAPGQGGSPEGAFLLFHSSSNQTAIDLYVNNVPLPYREKFDKFLYAVDAAGYSVRLNSSVRPIQPGAGRSKHWFGGAIDIQIKLKGEPESAFLHNAYNPPNSVPKYTTAVQTETIAQWNATPVPSIAGVAGLKWGGDFTKNGNAYGDVVHFEINIPVDDMAKGTPVMGTRVDAEGEAAAATAGVRARGR